MTVNNTRILKILLSKAISVDIADNSGKTAQQLSYELVMLQDKLELPEQYIIFITYRD